MNYGQYGSTVDIKAYILVIVTFQTQRELTNTINSNNKQTWDCADVKKSEISWNRRQHINQP